MPDGSGAEGERGSEGERAVARGRGPAAIEPHHASIAYPGGLRARWTWGGSGSGPAVFALSEAGATLTDHGPVVGPGYEELCRAELRVEGPGGSWAARFASTIFDEPTGFAWDTAGLLVVRYGFHTYGLDARTGDRRWTHRSASPIVAVFGSSRLQHVLVQAEIETFAIEQDGTVAWRLAHSDVVSAADLVGGRLVLTSYGGQVTALDPATGRTAH
ncbi:MAG TPA: PQQ-binding-like beta-propeller repeat protein [Candidatus Limnocylindrales bacterium]